MDPFNPCLTNDTSTTTVYVDPPRHCLRVNNDVVVNILFDHVSDYVHPPLFENSDVESVNVAHWPLVHPSCAGAK